MTPENLVLWSLYRKHLHGYGIMRFVNKELGLKLPLNTIYSQLTRLLDERLISCYPFPKGEQMRTTYFITDEGKTYFENQMRIVKEAIALVETSF